MTEQDIAEAAKEIIATGCGCDRNCEQSEDGYCGCRDDAQAVIDLVRRATADQR